jgi:hypothetical protein
LWKYLRLGYSDTKIDNAINKAKQALGKNYSPRRGFSQIETFI